MAGAGFLISELKPSSSVDHYGGQDKEVTTRQTARFH